MARSEIVILDYGSQYTQLIARAIRRKRVCSTILPWDWEEAQVLARQPAGLILSGGPSSVFDPGAPGLADYVLRMGVPVLGICYGMQLVARALGAGVVQAGRGEYGFTRLSVVEEDELFRSTPREQQVWMSHRDRIESPTRGMIVLASSPNCPIAAYSVPDRKLYGVQFHPEVEHTAHGDSMLENFLFDVCRCKRDWTPESIVSQSIEEIRSTAVEGRAICAVSGGVDSSVTATLASRALGERLVCVFVDNGLLREGERESVEVTLRSHLDSELHVVEAKKHFLERLSGVVDPEEKRKRVGNLFIEIFEEVSSRLGPFRYLAQGTLYPDRIESRSTFGPSDRIKTHHNVGGLPDDLGFELIEPLSFLFKDEVREIGHALGLPEELLRRHPFPGPGLAVRVLGEVTEERLELARKADKIFIDGLKRWNLYDQVWQAGVVLLPIKSVGVMGDARTYDHVVALRAVTSSDGMTADWARLDPEFLKEISSEIINSISGINRVVYDVSSKPPSTIEWE